jgi:uncharacterized integral membrane protein
VKAHRAVTLAVMMLLSVILLGAMTAYGVSTLSGQSLLALGIVVVAAAVAGIAFSVRRYFPRRR